jgi:hypothetical protein
MGATPRYTDYADLRRLLNTSANDTEICDAYERLLVSMNCEGAAKGYLAAVGLICARRPHLVDRLLRLPIDALLQIGADNVGAVVWFVDYLVREPDEYFARWAGDDGVQWLRAEFPKFAESMAPLLKECWLDLEARLRAIGQNQE